MVSDCESASYFKKIAGQSGLKLISGELQGLTVIMEILTPNRSYMW